MSNYNKFGEFELINQFFCFNSDASKTSKEYNVLGIGDDCALFNNDKEQNSWAISKDLLIENIHFFSDVSPTNLGHKALAVNLSDLAAMGATPKFFLLGIALP